MNYKRIKHRNFLDSNTIFSCNTCHCHLLDKESIVSKTFHGSSGPAYLVDNVTNVSLGTREERMLMTGIHTVADVNCVQCHVKLGWKYIRALEESQKYKEGKFIIEKSRLVKDFDYP